MNNKNPYFSIVVTTYNLEKYIVETLESIDKQIFKDYEVIIVDDCSEDDTVEITKKYINGKENWKLICNEKNIGVSESRNKGFSLVSGEYIAMLDGDDVWLDIKLIKCYELITETNADVCYSSYSFVSETGEVLEHIQKVKPVALYEDLLKENFVLCSTIVFDSKIFPQISMNKQYQHEDFVFMLDILKNGYTCKGVMDPLVQYRVHQQSRSFNKFEAAKNRFIVYKEHEQLPLYKIAYIFTHYTFNGICKYINVMFKHSEE